MFTFIGTESINKDILQIVYPNLKSFFLTWDLNIKLYRTKFPQE